MSDTDDINIDRDGLVRTAEKLMDADAKKLEASRQCRLVEELDRLFAVLGFGPEQADGTGGTYRTHTVSGAFIETQRYDATKWNSVVPTSLSIGVSGGTTITGHDSSAEAAWHVFNTLNRVEMKSVFVTPDEWRALLEWIDNPPPVPQWFVDAVRAKAKP